MVSTLNQPPDYNNHPKTGAVHCTSGCTLGVMVSAKMKNNEVGSGRTERILKEKFAAAYTCGIFPFPDVIDNRIHTRKMENKPQEKSSD